MDKEIRTITDNTIEVRSIGNKQIVEGYGIVFNSESADLGGFREIILPNAVDGVIEHSDILALVNHDISRGVLARSIKGKGSLKLSVDNTGVKYSFEVPNFNLGYELVEGIKRGDIKGSSFAFSVTRDGEQLKRLNDGSYLRTIVKFDELYDMSPCYREAYQDTTVALRSLDEFKNTTKDLTNETETKLIIGEESIVEPIVEVPIVKRTISEREQDLKRKNYMLKYKIK